MSAKHLPQARQGLTTQTQPQGLTVTDQALGQTWVLDGLQAQVWAGLEGMTNVADLARQLSQGPARVSADQVWSALDALADLGLLTQRAAPPAQEKVSSHRPLMGRRQMAMAGLAVAAAPMAFAATVADEQQAKVTPNDESMRAEQEAKAAQPADASMTAEKRRKMQEQDKKAQLSASRVQEADQKKSAKAAEQTNKQGARSAEETRKSAQ